MDRRTFVGSTLAAAASSSLVGPAHAQPMPKAKNVVLVHGLFADGSQCSGRFISTYSPAKPPTAA